MTVYKVGEKYIEFIGHPEEVRFDMDDGGASLIVYFNQPTSNEVAQFKENKDFEIRFTTLENIIFLTFKIGNLNWMDAPYTPHLSKNLTKVTFPGQNMGLSFTIYLVNTFNGELLSIRLLGLSESFSQALISAIIEERMNSFDPNSYNEKLIKVFHKYNTKQLAKMATAYCKFRGQ